jgi:3-oxoacyl-[acyl-carrier protein] reductase
LDLKLAGKTALVTGASSVGLGRAIALGLACEGTTVAITARRGDLLRQAAQEILAASGHEPCVIEGDLYQPEAPARIAAEAHAKLGRIDILVNAAGGSRPIPFDTPPAVWEESMLLNFFRLRELTHAILPGMMEQKWGRVISLTGTSEPYNINAANPAKAAIHAWTKGLSREMGKYAITLNCIKPGRITSEQMLRMHPTEEKRREFTKEVPLERFGNPEELADLAVFLASPRASYITGTAIAVDGGLSRFSF